MYIGRSAPSTAIGKNLRLNYTSCFRRSTACRRRQYACILRQSRFLHQCFLLPSASADELPITDEINSREQLKTACHSQIQRFRGPKAKT